MKNLPKVTIFILVYNNADGLETTVNSVMEQDYTNAEVIISDDGSKNYDTELLQGYAAILKEKYPEVYVNINPVNVGTVKHLNVVLHKATGDILISCSSGDSFASSDTVSHIVRYFETHDELIVTTRRRDVYNDGHIKLRPSKLIGFLLRYNPSMLLNHMITKKNELSGCCTFYRKECFEQYGYHDESYHLVEDYPYYVRLLFKQVKIGWMSEPTINHGIGGVSTGRIHPSIYKDIEQLREDLYPIRHEFNSKTVKYLEKCHEQKGEKSDGD